MTDNDINFTVKFSGKLIPITISPDSTVLLLKSLLLPLTNVPVRGQKLIFRGKILVNEVTLREVEVTNGVTVMLVAAPTQEVLVGKNSLDLEQCKAAGVITLAKCNLKAIPEEVWDCKPFLRFLDISNNSIQHVPNEISLLTGLKKLFLNANGLSDESMNWRNLALLEHLTVLSVSKNCLNALPFDLGFLTALKKVDISYNQLTALPNEIGSLSKLEVLKANNNRICYVPEYIGECASLIEIDLSSNLLSEVPIRFVFLRNLKDAPMLHIQEVDPFLFTPSIEMFSRTLRLSNNALKSLPDSIFTMCDQLSTLDLDDTEITVDVLHEFPGWEDFDKRQHEKQLDSKVMDSDESC